MVAYISISKVDLVKRSSLIHSIKNPTKEQKKSVQVNRLAGWSLYLEWVEHDSRREINSRFIYRSRGRVYAMSHFHAFTTRVCYLRCQVLIHRICINICHLLCILAQGLNRLINLHFLIKL